ncbi:MAG: hypothetical protein WC824_14825 [Bacteroidota bacterium]|jgi:hypothetical protein
MWFLYTWLYLTIGVPIVCTILETIRLHNQPDLLTWVMQNLPPTKKQTLIVQILTIVILWPALLLLLILSAKKHQTILEFLVHSHLDRLAKAEKEEEKKRVLSDETFTLIDQKAKVQWEPDNCPDWRLQFIRHQGTGLPIHFVKSLEGSFCLWRVQNNFDDQKDQPYARFSTFEEALQSGTDDTEWIQIRKHDLAAIISKLNPNHITFHITLPELPQA